MKTVLANWKAHKTMSEIEAWLETFCQLHSPHSQVEVIIAPPALYLVPMWQRFQREKITHITLAIQDLSPYPQGSYTGEIAAAMVHNFVEYAILGHSERRRYFDETNQAVANKVSEAMAAKIKPIVCVDRPYARAQIAALQEEDINGLIIGYGPVEAIGIDIPQSPAKTKEAIGEIRAIVPDISILYGGSINKENVGDYLNIAGVDGLMVGTASLDPQEFALICKRASQA